MSIPMQMQTKITGYHLEFNCPKCLNVNQKSKHARKANSEGNFLVSQSAKDDTSKYCRQSKWSFRSNSKINL